MKTKRYDVGSVRMTGDGKAEGFKMKRDVTLSEAKHIVSGIFGIDICTAEDFYDRTEYKDYNRDFLERVNEWLKGNSDDASLMDLASGYIEDGLGAFNVIPMTVYLKKKGVID